MEGSPRRASSSTVDDVLSPYETDQSQQLSPFSESDVFTTAYTAAPGQQMLYQTVDNGHPFNHILPNTREGPYLKIKVQPQLNG